MTQRLNDVQLREIEAGRCRFGCDASDHAADLVAEIRAHRGAEQQAAQRAQRDELARSEISSKLDHLELVADLLGRNGYRTVAETIYRDLRDVRRILAGEPSQTHDETEAVRVEQ